MTLPAIDVVYSTWTDADNIRNTQQRAKARTTE